MTTEIIEKKTCYDLGSLIEALEEIRDERADGRELPVLIGFKPLADVLVILGKPENSEWVELR